MKTVGNILFIVMIITLAVLQGDSQPAIDRSNKGNGEFAYSEIDRDRYVNQQPNTAFKLYPYHNRLNRRHVT